MALPTRLDYRHIYEPETVVSTYHNGEYSTTTDGWTGIIEQFRSERTSSGSPYVDISGNTILPFTLEPIGKTIARCPELEKKDYSRLSKIPLSVIPKYSMVYVLKVYKGVKHIVHMGVFLYKKDGMIRIGHPDMTGDIWKTCTSFCLTIAVPESDVITTGEFLTRDYTQEYKDIQLFEFNNNKRRAERDIIQAEMNIRSYKERIDREKERIAEAEHIKTQKEPTCTTPEDELVSLLKNKRIEKARFQYGTYYIMTKKLQRTNETTGQSFQGRARMKNLGRLVLKITPEKGMSTRLEGNACGTIQKTDLDISIERREPMHPHISSGVCLGDQLHAFYQAVAGGNLASAVDQIITGMTYVPQHGAPYFGYDQFLEEFIYDTETDDYFSKKYYDGN
jgi:hypothetical protein